MGNNELAQVQEGRIQRGDGFQASFCESQEFSQLVLSILRWGFASTLWNNGKEMNPATL